MACEWQSEGGGPPRLTRVFAVLSAARDHPQGDTAVSLTLHVPLTADGQLDHELLGRLAEYVRVERGAAGILAWSSPLLSTDDGWAVRPGPSEEAPLWTFDVRTLRPGEYVTLVSPEGSEEVYRIVNVEAC